MPRSKCPLFTTKQLCALVPQGITYAVAKITRFNLAVTSLDLCIAFTLLTSTAIQAKMFTKN